MIVLPSGDAACLAWVCVGVQAPAVMLARILRQPDISHNHACTPDKTTKLPTKEASHKGL